MWTDSGAMLFPDERVLCEEWVVSHDTSSDRSARASDTAFTLKAHRVLLCRCYPGLVCIAAGLLSWQGWQ